MMLRKTLTEILFKECFYAKAVCLNVVESFFILFCKFCSMHLNDPNSQE